MGALALGAGGTAAGASALRRGVRRARNDHRRRPALWNRFYAIDWGDTTTNNYGFAPAPGSDPQRFQHQMYRELLHRLDGVRRATAPLRLLEISCGLGGGLAALLAEAPDRFDATGLDVAANAVAFCRRRYGESDRLRFVQGGALDLPFADASFDVVLNVEASNDYGDRAGFFREVARVLEPGGIFLYADNFRSRHVADMRGNLAAAGLTGEFCDITANVAHACRLDSPRRRSVLRRHVPLIARLLLSRELENYAAIEGSGKYRSFADGRRAYLMTAAVKA